ncbi:cytochrome P450 [Streptomyces sp. NPDC057717]|uniref:cytochrome P450 n=1 Tax=Streptomyces sp. NPDC057717 TaxID=3346224 RepID=UPI0036B3DAB0
MTDDFIAGSAPRPLPVVGHMFPLMRRPIDFLGSLSEYGDLVEIRLGPTPAYVPCHPALVRQVLTNDRVFDKGGPLYDRARAIVGNGLGSCPHSDHRRQRRLVQPAFHRQRMSHYATVMENEVSALTESWEEGQAIDAFPAFYDLALRISTRTLFAGNVDESDISRIRGSFDVALHRIVKTMFLPPALQNLPTPANRRYKQALDYLHEAVGRIVSQYRESGVDHGDLMSMLIAAADEEEGGGGLDDTEVHDQVMSLLLASSETVPACLAWTLHTLSLQPEVLIRLQEEVDSVVKGPTATWSDVEELPYTQRVLTETLRLYPPGWLFTRVATQGVELAGRHLPPGAIIIFSPPAVHGHADAFDNPEKFDPDRWLPGRMPAVPRGSFASFGGGARKCIGDNFAMAEMVIALATMVRSWRFECVPGSDLRPASLATVCHPRRLLLKIGRRGPKLANA